MAIRKKSKKANGGASTFGPDVPDVPVQPADVFVMSDGDQPTVNMADGAVNIPTEDGFVNIIFAEPEPPKDVKFDTNLAEVLDDFVLGRIAETILEGIEQDERDRSEWLQQRADGLELLGMKIDKPGAGNVGSTATAVPGQSTVRDALLAEACDRFQANAFAELCPSQGPCKVMSYGPETAETDNLAEEFEKDFNFYLTGSGEDTAKEYYPDTRKMLWWTGYASGMFKKIYRCPLRERPVSESVDGADLIVPSNATDLHNAARITHHIDMNRVTLKKMQLEGAYRDVDLTMPTPQPNALVQKEGVITGLNPNPTLERDQNYTIYECYCHLDIPGYEHKRGNKPTGLPVPYRVVIDKDSRIILEIRRNWKQPKEGEEDQLPIAKIPFVMFSYATGLGFYGTGLLHRLGNYTMALTAMLRECIDAGMFASFPGFLYAKPLGRQLQNEFRVPPGGGAPIDVSAVGNNINNAVMPLPYKDVSTAMVALMAQTREQASRYGGTADSPTGEGVMNAPVGSVLAAIDQATRIEGGVHKALYAAQREELEQLRELFREDPEALWRGNRRPAMGQDQQIRLAKFKQALENYDLVPAADPNVPSRMHRLAKASTYLQMAMAMPGVFNLQRVIMRWASMVDIDDIQNDFAPQQGQPQMDPMQMAALALKMREVQVKEGQLQISAQNAQADRQSKEQIEAMKVAASHAAKSQTPQGQPDPYKETELHLKGRQQDLNEAKLMFDTHNAQADRDSREAVEAFKLAQTAGVHPEATGVMDQQLNQLSAFLQPAAQKRVADGGAVNAPEPAEAPKPPANTLHAAADEPSEEDMERAKAIKLALDIAEALAPKGQTYDPNYSPWLQ